LYYYNQVLFVASALMFSQHALWRLPSCGIWRRVAWNKSTELCRNIPHIHLLCRTERTYFSDTENTYHTGSAKFQKAISVMKWFSISCFFSILSHVLYIFLPSLSFLRNFFLVCFCLSLSLSVCLSVASFIAISTSHPFLFNFLFLIHPPILPTSVRFEVLMMVRYLWGWRQEILLRRCHISTKTTWCKTQ